MQHKWGTSVVHKVTLTCFLDILGIVHLMYGYIHESSEIKFLLNNVQFGLVSLCFIPKICTLCKYMGKEKHIYNTKYLFIYLI